MMVDWLTFIVVALCVVASYFLGYLTGKRVMLENLKKREVK